MSSFSSDNSKQEENNDSNTHTPYTTHDNYNLSSHFLSLSPPVYLYLLPLTFLAFPSLLSNILCCFVSFSSFFCLCFPLSYSSSLSLFYVLFQLLPFVFPIPIFSYVSLHPLFLPPSVSLLLIISTTSSSFISHVSLHPLFLPSSVYSVHNFICFVFHLLPIRSVCVPSSHLPSVSFSLPPRQTVSDERLRRTCEVLAAARLVKVHGWEEEFLSKITSVRKKELALLHRDSLLRAFMSKYPPILSLLRLFLLLPLPLHALPLPLFMFHLPFLISFFVLLCGFCHHPLPYFLLHPPSQIPSRWSQVMLIK